MSASPLNRETARYGYLREAAYFRYSSPLFAALSRASADDEEMLDIGAESRPGQSAGQIVPCAAQYLLFQYPDSKLARFFPSLTPEAAPAERAFPAFKAFCLEHRDELTDLISWRTANTNLVEKASSLLPALRHIADRLPLPMTLLEVCCSAGLNLMFDQYHYDYGDAGTVGPEDSPVRLSCKAVGKHRPPVDSVPLINKRLGVDLVEVDPTEPEERLWMEAVLCPEWIAERARLRSALTIRAEYDLQTIIGDGLEVVPPLLEELPGSLCILQSYCMGHWSTEAKAEWEQVLLRASKHREIHRLSMEMPEYESPQVARRRLALLSRAGVPILQKSFPSCIEHRCYRDGKVTTQLLARGDGFGWWLDWQPEDA